HEVREVAALGGLKAASGYLAGAKSRSVPRYVRESRREASHGRQGQSVVGVVGLEPTTSCSQSTCATNCATPRIELDDTGRPAIPCADARGSWAANKRERSLPADPRAGADRGSRRSRFDMGG